MPHILIVCTANICRSPLLEGLLRQRLQKQGLTSWKVSSAGTWVEMARPAARFSQKLATQQGISLEKHVSRMVTREMVADADLVLCMTANHKEALRLDFTESADKIYLISEMVGRTYDIEDPYGGPMEEYVVMNNSLNRILDEGLPRIITLAQG